MRAVRRIVVIRARREKGLNSICQKGGWSGSGMEDVLAPEMRKKVKSWEHEEGRERDAVEDAKCEKGTQYDGGYQRGSLLQVINVILIYPDYVEPTLLSRIRCIITKLHATSNVSIEFENVCVWYVHVTYELATSVTASFRRRGDCTSSWIAQSSSTKLNMNIKTRRV